MDGDSCGARDKQESQVVPREILGRFKANTSHNASGKTLEQSLCVPGAGQSQLDKAHGDNPMNSTLSKGLV